MATRIFHRLGSVIIAKRRTYYSPENKWRIYVDGEFWDKVKDLQKGIKKCKSDIYKAYKLAGDY